MSNSLPFAQRTNWPLAANKLSADLERLHNERVPILDLTESNPTRCGFSYLQDDIVNSLAEKNNLNYTPLPRGGLRAREAISRYYKEKKFLVSAEQIFLTASTSEAYSYLFRLLVDPGGQVLFPRPSYPLFTFLGDLNDLQMDTYPLIYDGKWAIDISRMSHALCDDTKAVVLVNPNNPTGSFICRGELEKINALCKKTNAALICDEVFADFAFTQNEDRVSLVDNDQVLTFILGGVSKSLGMPQMKLSWIIVNGPKHLAEEASARLDVIADTYLSVNTPTQNAFPAWLSNRKEIQGEINARIRQNLDFLKKKTQTVHECELLNAEGGWYAVLKIPDTYSEEKWALTFLNKDHVFIHPGYFFDFDNEAFAVVSLLPAGHIFQEGIQRIFARIKSNEL